MSRNYTMQVPKRKPGKYTRRTPDPHLTPGKLAELQRQLDRLRATRPAAIAEMQRLAELGDFSENAAYQLAKGRLRGINQRMLELEYRLQHAVPITPTGQSDTVQLGCRVTVSIASRQQTFRILGSEEADPSGGVISHHSPLGSALMGHRAGETVQFKINGRSVGCTILEIA